MQVTPVIFPVKQGTGVFFPVPSSSRYAAHTIWYGIIGQFHDVQKEYTRKGLFGRYIDHEVFSLSNEYGNLVLENNLDIDRIGRRMAYDIYNGDCCQVIYGIHKPLSEDKHLHIHFAVNTVNFETRKKRRENTRETKEREARFIEILEEEIQQQLTDRTTQ